MINSQDPIEAYQDDKGWLVINFTAKQSEAGSTS